MGFSGVFSDFSDNFLDFFSADIGSSFLTIGFLVGDGGFYGDLGLAISFFAGIDGFFLGLDLNLDIIF